MLLFDNPLDFHVLVVSVTPVSIVKILQIHWNIKTLCDTPSVAT